MNRTLLAISAVVLIIVITIILIVVLPASKCYYDEEELNVVININDEELKKYIDTGQVGIVYDKYDPQIDKLVVAENFSSIGRQLYIPTKSYIRRVIILKLDKKSMTPYTKLPAGIANYTLRIVYCTDCLNNKVGVNVNGVPKILNNKCIIDASKEHCYFNKHNRKSAYILLVDIDRPQHIPIGSSTILDDYVY